jgi:hypothetical protein
VIGHCDYLHMPGWGAARAVKALDRMKIFKTKPKSQGEVAMSFDDNISLEKVITSMKKVHEVPGDGAELIATALAVYLRQVVFNPVTKTEMPLADVGKEGLDASPLPDACGVIATGEVQVQTSDSDEKMTLPRAEAHALGFFETRDTVEPMPVRLAPVARLVPACMRHAQFLTPDMVAGAGVPAADVSAESIAEGPKAGKVVLASLQLFLLTRGYNKVSELKWAAAAQQVQDKLGLEADLLERAVQKSLPAPDIFLRDRAGGTLVEYLIQRGVATLADFPQSDGGLTIPANDDRGWLDDLRVIENVFPGLTEEILCEFYGSLGAQEDGNARVLERGYQHIEPLGKLLHFSVHLSPIQGRPNVVALRFQCPASYRSHDYMVTA